VTLPFPITIIPSDRALRLYWAAPAAPNGVLRNASGTPVIAAVIGLGGGGGGNGGGVTTIDLPSAVTLSGHRAVIATSTGAAYPSMDDIDHGDAIIGVTQHAASQGTLVSVQDVGPMTEMTWNWDAGLPVFAGDQGVLTQAVPPGKWIRQVGVAVAPHRIVLSQRPAIVRAL